MIRAKGMGQGLWLAVCAAGLVLALGSWSGVGATTWYVDQNNPNASDTGPGTAAQPFKTINQGTGVAVAGDTVLVSAGRYYEGVTFANNGAAGQPITLKAALGQRVIVDGGAVLTPSSWVQCDSSYAGRNSNYAHIYHIDYTAQSTDRPYAVYQDDALLLETVWPAVGWYQPTSVTASSPSSTLTDTVHLTQPDGWWTGGRVINFATDINYLNDTIITSYTQATHTLSANGSWFDMYAYNRYQIYDKMETITGPGQWAFDRLGGANYRLYVWPAGGGSPSSHVMTVPYNIRFVISLGTQTNIVIDGLEVCHSDAAGVGAYGNGAPYYGTIQNCCIHDNIGGGISLNNMPNMTVYHNYIGYNGGGVGSGASNTYITENEICYNGTQGPAASCDGIDLCGPQDGVAWTTGCVVNHNYVHDHTDWHSHPDSIQTYNNVSGTLIENNIFLCSVQGYMLQGNNVSTTLSNNIWAQSQGDMINNYPSISLTLQHDTLANAGYENMGNTLSMGFSFYNNLFYLGHGSDPNYIIAYPNPTASYASDFNFFYPANGASEAHSPVYYATSAGIQWNCTWAQYRSATGQDAHSIYYSSSGNGPQFINAPVWFSQCDQWHQVFFTPSKVYMANGNNDMPNFAAGDHIEIDHDGVVRTVTGSGTDTTTIPGSTLCYLTFTPSEARVATSAGVVANWKTNTNYNVNYNLQNTSPARGQGQGGSDMGASINMAQMVKGDFNGDGVRDIPVWPYAPPVTLTVQINPSGGGTVTVTPSQVYYANGDTVQILATPATSPFSGWVATGGTVLTSTASLTTLTISGNCTLTAYFTGPSIPEPLVTQASPAGGGKVTVTPSQTQYPSYTTVSIQASVNPGYYFVSWSVTGGVVSNANAASTSLIITSSCTLTANFLPPLPLVTQVSPSGLGTITVTPSLATYPPNTVVTIQATASSGYALGSWTASGGTVSNATAATTSLVITGSCTLTANFVPGYTGAEVGTGGTITLSATGIYTYGQVITATASAGPGYVFSGWSVTGLSTLSSSAAATTSLTVNDNFTLTASFTAIPYTLTAVASPAWGGTVVCTPSQASYTYGNVLLIQATPANSNYLLVGWVVNGGTVYSASAALTDLTITDNCTLTAVFADTAAVPLDISSGFNMSVWCSPTMYNTLVASGSTFTAYYGQELQGYAYNLCCPKLLVADSSTAEPGSVYSGLSYLTGGQGVPENGVLTSNVDGRVYMIASISGNALLSGDRIEAGSKNVAIVGQWGQAIIGSGGWSVGSVTMSVTPGYYADINFLLAGGGSYGAEFMQIWAVYSDTTSTKLYDFGSSYRVWADPGFGGGNTDSNFALVYAPTWQFTDGWTNGTVTNYWGPATFFYEFATPRSLNPNKQLQSIKVVDTQYAGGGGGANWSSRELGIFAATTTPIPQVTLTVNQTPGGTVSVSPTQVTYTQSAVVTITASANTGFSFGGWAATGGTVTNAGSASTSLTITSNGTLAASFTPISYSGTETNPGGTISVSNSGPYTYGQVITATASAYSGYAFSGWSVTGPSTLSGLTAATALLTVYGNFTLTAHFTQETFTVMAATSTTWVYQNTPVSTLDRHAVTLTVSVTADTWGNSAYTTTVTQSGSGVVTPTGSWTSGNLVTPTPSAAWAGLTGYLVGGRRTDGLSGTGSCALLISVAGNSGGTATTTLTLLVRPLGDINGSGLVDLNDLAILDTRLNNFAIAPRTSADCELSGDGAVTTADRVLLNRILNNLTVP